MRKFKSLPALILSTAFITPALADDNNYKNKKSRGCTTAAINAAESYDPGLGKVTTCIKKRNNVKVVIAWNNNLRNGKVFNTSGATIGQQAVNARNLARDFENNYDMMHGDEFNAVVVAYASGVDWLKKSSEQANQDFIVNNILARGIKIYACQNTMKAKGLKLADLIDGVETVPAGVSAVVDFQNQGMTYLVP